MSKFKKYQHVERFGTSEVDGIEYGKCYIFPKIDGTNSSIWLENNKICAGSRRRHLFDGERDNAGFREWAQNNDGVRAFFDQYPDLRVYGEWLVPHSLKTYRENAWRKFYVFDVMCDDTYLPYDEYAPKIEGFFDYIPPLATIENPDLDALHKIMEDNDYLIETGGGVGEGIVIKNYDWKNQHGRIVWAKMVRSEFKEQHRLVMGAAEKKAKDCVEEAIVSKYLTNSVVEKIYAHISESECGWKSEHIPRLLNTVYYDLVREECWNFVKEHRNPRIDFKRLMGFTFQRVKKIKPELF